MKRYALICVSAGFISTGSIFLAGSMAYAQSPQIEGSVSTSDGVPAKSYPVIIEGKTASGEDYNSFVTTDDAGMFQIQQLPPGEYKAMPAGEPDAAVQVTVPEKPWYDMFKKNSTTDIGDLPVTVGPKTPY